MVASAKRKAERAKAFAGAHAKSIKQTKKNARKDTKTSTATSKRKLDASSAAVDSNDGTDVNEPDSEHAETNTPKTEQPARDKNHRFILFIGNLPFNTTTSQIESHFASVQPSSIRHSTDKSTGKSKGFAFLEFEDYTRMTTCLKNFHHSLFPAPAPAPAGGAADTNDTQEKAYKKRGEGRKINVELTVGGGGSKSTARKMKLRAKNERLTGERRKNAAAPRKRDPNPTTISQDDGENHIHPSRRAKVTM